MKNPKSILQGGGVSSVELVGIVGAGTMGRGIAQTVAAAGIKVILVDVSEKALEFARDKISSGSKEIIEFSHDFSRLSHVDIFIEAVPEKIELKKEIFSIADKILPDGALLSTNTSSLSVGEISNVTKRAQNVIGLHFFNPVDRMKLLEIVRHDHTSDESIKRGKEFATMLGKTSIVVKDSPGFATSRLGICIAFEAMRMVEQGVASVEDIDAAMVLGYGFPVGPLKLTDIVGLDVRLAIGSYLFDKLSQPQFEPPMILREKVKGRQLGKKSGSGFYMWSA